MWRNASSEMISELRNEGLKREVVPRKDCGPKARVRHSTEVTYEDEARGKGRPYR